MRTGLVLGVTVILGTALWAIPSAWADGGARCGKGEQMFRHHGHGHSSAGGHLLRHLLTHRQDIGLQDDQVDKLRSLALDADRAAIRESADRMVSERELRAMMWEAKTDMPAIEAKVKEAESHDATVRIIGIRAKRDMFAVLTPDQQAKFKALRHGRGHGGGGSRADADSTPASDAHQSDAATPAS